MAQRNHTQTYVLGRGRLYFAPYDANDNSGAERYLGNTPGFSVEIESETLEHFSAESGVQEKDSEVTLSIDRTANIEADDVSNENLALFIIGGTATLAQSSTPVTNERVQSISGEGTVEYQMGTTTSNPSGVRDVSGVAIRSYDGANASARADTTAYVVGDTYTSGGDWYYVTAAGTSAGSAPTFNTSAIGDTTTDGTVTVAYMGTTSDYTVTTDYELDTDLGRFWTASGGVMRDIEAWAEDNDVTDLSWEVDYTPAANSRVQVTSEQTTSTTGALRFIADNAQGENRDLYCPKVQLSPSGELAFKSGDEFVSMTFSAAITKKDTSTQAVYIDGRPVA